MSVGKTATTHNVIAEPSASGFGRRHRIAIYFGLTFALSWGGVLVIIARRGGVAGTSAQTDPLLYLAMLIGPPVAGLLMTATVSGRAGFRALLARLLHGNVAVGWYALALLLDPMLAAASLLLLLPTSPVFLPGIMQSADKSGLVLSGLLVGLVVGLFEELGWMGFAAPELRQQHGVLATGLILGLFWGAWHLLLFFWSSGGFSGSLSLALFLPAVLFCGAVAPAYRVLMVWVYERTQSLPVMIVMHAGSTGGVLFVVMPVAISGAALVSWYVVFAALLWAVVGAVEMSTRWHSAHRVLRTRAA